MATLDFWARSHTWPRDPLGYVFLARAIDEIGRALFGDKWTGKEVTTTPVLPLPERKKATTSDRFRAHEVLTRLHPEYVRQRQTEASQVRAQKAVESDSRASTSAFPPSLSRFPGRGTIDPAPSYYNSAETWSDEWWSVAQATVLHEQEAQGAIHHRLRTVQREIVARCESGELTSALRPTDGGTMTLAPAHFWNTENWSARFTMCQMNPRQPFGIGFAGDDYCWIFVTRESLEAYLKNQSSAQRIEGTAAGEKAALVELTRMLKADNNLRRMDAQNALSKFKVSQQGFRRIWTVAREQAGLARRAPPGRKPGRRT